MISDHVEEFLPAYSLDALEEEERRRVEAHLEHCFECALSLAAYQETTSQLALLVQPVSPPASLRQRLLAASKTQGRVASVHPVEVIRRRPTLAALVSLAAVVLLVLMGALGWTTVRLNTLKSQNQRMAEALLQQQSLAYLVAYPNTSTFSLRSPRPGGTTWGFVMGSHEREWGLLVAIGMPPLPKDQVYQLWLVSGVQSFGGGTFTVDDAGYGQLSLRMAEPLRTFDRVRVTAEPLGGSLQPTSDPILLGSLFATRTN